MGQTTYVALLPHRPPMIASIAPSSVATSRRARLVAAALPELGACTNSNAVTNAVTNAASDCRAIVGWV